MPTESSAEARADLKSASDRAHSATENLPRGAKCAEEKPPPCRIRGWASLLVVAVVAHQARAREIAVQYFERRLGETAGEDASGEDRLVVLESRFQAADQRGGLAAHQVDRRHSLPIFGEADRMQSDVLADSGGLLDRLLPPASGTGLARRPATPGTPRAAAGKPADVAGAPPGVAPPTPR
jgi:hypothetical protein